MQNFYEVGKDREGKLTILIHRKPSEIPMHVDQELMRICGTSTMDGPRSLIVYACLPEGSFDRAVEYLHLCGWKPEIKF